MRVSSAVDVHVQSHHSVPFIVMVHFSVHLATVPPADDDAGPPLSIDSIAFTVYTHSCL